jgi:hypothetical protein
MNDQKYAGIDIVLVYTPSLLEFEDLGISDATSCTSQNPGSTSIFSASNLYSVENDANNGIVRITRSSGNVTTDTMPLGRVCPATIYFRAKSSSPATAFIRFEDDIIPWKVVGSGIEYGVFLPTDDTITIDINGGAVPTSPSLTSNDLVFTTDDEIVLSWSETPNAAEYMAELVFNNGTQQTYGWQRDIHWNVGVLPPGRYELRVKARNWKGESNWSSSASFMVQTALTPTPVTPTPSIPSPTPSIPNGNSLYVPMLHR